MDARRLAATVLVIWLAAACTGDKPVTSPGSPPPAPPPPPPPGQPPPPPPPPTKPVGWFVAPDGSDGADGTIDHPWSYARAFAGAGGAIKPGDTVWFRGGTYPLADHPITVNGTGETSRVVFRAYPGERAILTGNHTTDGDWINVEASWLTLRDLEITNTSGDRSVSRGTGIYNNGNCNRFLNLVVHDAGNGFYAEPVRYGVEIIGSIFYNNGWQDVRGHGHAMYIKSNPTPPNTCSPGQARIVVRDNVAFNNYGYGIHSYTDRAEGESGVLLEGNVLFNNGSIADAAFSNKSSNLLLAGDKDVIIVDNDTVRKNMSYYSPAAKLENPGDGIRAGYDPGAWSSRHDHAVVTDNYAVGGQYALEIRSWDSIEVARNVAAGPRVAHLEDAGLANYTWSANTFYADAGSRAWYFNAPPASEGSGITWQQWKDATGLGVSDVVASAPAAPKVFVRPLAPYAPGRGNIIIYNWTLAASVPVDLSPVLNNGDAFAVWNVQDLFAKTPVVSGTYKGGTVNIPMTGVTPPPPQGGTRMPPRTAPEFDVFVVQRTTSN